MERLTAGRRGIAAIAVVVVALLAGGVAMAASRSTPSLRRISAGSLIGSVARAEAARPSVSGTLMSHVALGLPSLPEDLPGPAKGLVATLGYVNGDHRLRAWASRDGARVAELLPGAELDYVADRTDAWAWDSESFTAYHLGPLPQPSPLALDPSNAIRSLDLDAIARQAIASVAGSTAVSVGAPVRVAGRAAYPLLIRPRSSATLVGVVEIDVDASTRVPLRVAATPRGASVPALSIGYASVSFGPIDPRTFAFTPPEGAKVERFRPPSASESHSGGPLPAGASDVRTIGRDWSTVVAVRLPAAATSARSGFDASSILPLSTPLLSVRIVRRGDHAWLLAGAVPQSGLAVAAARLG